MRRVSRRVVWAASMGGLALGNLVSANCFTGEAYDLNTQAKIYTEHHLIDKRSSPHRQHVTYFSPDNTPLATKSLAFETAGYLPNFRFTDLRTQESIEARVEANRTGREITIQTADSGGKQREQIPIAPEGDSVADAGFNAFITSRWDRLRAGEVVRFEFLAVTRARFVTFRARQKQVDTESVIIEVAPENWLFRLLVDPILLTYDLATQRLMKYAGLTNIAKLDSAGRSTSNYTAVIRYTYDDCTETIKVEGDGR